MRKLVAIVMAIAPTVILSWLMYSSEQVGYGLLWICAAEAGICLAAKRIRLLPSLSVALVSAYSYHFDHICTATGTTGIGDELSYHVAILGNRIYVSIQGRRL